MDSWIDIYNIFAGFIERFYTDFFFWVLNTSISASFLVAAIIILRLILKKAPKAIIVALWGMVAIRLICPFSLESALSLIPSKETIPTEQFQYQETRNDDYNLHIVSNPIYPEEIDYTMPGDVESTSWDSMYAYFGWLGGMGVMLIYSAASYIIIKRKVRISAPYKDNILLCDGIKTPFILGVFKPKIYLPSDISDEEKEYVIAHEKAHLKRKDHWWKPLGFLLLSFHWFNPLMWVAYILLCRDIEFACDEKVIRSLGEEGKKPYSEALLNCSVPRKMITSCPVAFGETGVKSRIKSVLNYKKPAFWVILIAVILSIAVGIGFMTDPIKHNSPDNIRVKECSSSFEGLSLEITDADFSDFAPFIEIRWINESDSDFVIYDDYHKFDRKSNGEWVSCNITDSLSYSNQYHKLNSGETFTYRYPISLQDMSESGTYRFEGGYYRKDGEAKITGSASIVFEVKHGKTFPNVHHFSVTDYVYDNGSYSWTGPSVEDIGAFRIIGEMNLQKHNGFDWQKLGYMEEIMLNEDNFDSRFRNDESWYQGLSVKRLKNENKRAWQLYANEIDVKPLYVLLEQENGDFYLCYGYHNEDGQVNPNSDSSVFRWVYRLKATGSAVENTSTAKWIPNGWFVSYAGYTTDARFFSGAVNADTLSGNTVQHLPVYKIDTDEELAGFKNEFADLFDFSYIDEKQTPFDSLAETVDFSEDSLLVVYVTAPTLQYEFSVDLVTVNNGELMISVISNAPEPGDTAMLGNFILVTVNKKDIEGCNSFDAVLNNVFLNQVHLDRAVEAAITEKYQESISKGEYACAAFEILKSEIIFDESQDFKIKLYLTTCYTTFSTKNNKLETAGAVSDTAVMTFVQNTDGTFSLLDYYVPIKGDNSEEAKKLYSLSFAYDGIGAYEICVMEAQKELGVKAESEEPKFNPDGENTVTYILRNSPDPLPPTVILDKENKTASFRYSGFSSYNGIYSYTVQNNSLRLESLEEYGYGYGLHYVFTVKDDTLVFDKNRSSDIPRYKYSENGEPETPVPHNAVFEQSIKNKINTVWSEPVF